MRKTYKLNRLEEYQMLFHSQQLLHKSIYRDYFIKNLTDYDNKEEMKWFNKYAFIRNLFRIQKPIPYQ